MSAESYFQHPLYQQASHHFQRGEWKAGLVKMEELIRLFPLEQELRALRKELLFKDRLDQSALGDRSTEKRKRLRTWAVRIAALVIVGVIGFLVVSSYSDWMTRQLSDAAQRAEDELRNVTVAAMYRDAKALLQVGRLAEAEAVAEEIAVLDAGFPGLGDLHASISHETALASLYQLGMQQIEAGDWLEAKSTLALLTERQPNYLDVDLQLMYIERQTLLGNLLNEGEAAIASEDWEQAVTAFDAVRKLHPEYEPEYMEARLFESLVNAGRAVLVGREDSLAALEHAEAHLRKALALRPQDPEIKRERELAGLFLKSQSDFDQGNWSEVILALERVMEVDASYAQGTARQTLYDAYVASGESLMTLHSYGSALNDFERALALGKQDQEAALRLYEAERKVAEAYGATGNFEAAVVHYKAAADYGSLATRGDSNSALINALQTAETYAAIGNFGVAYEGYQRAMALADGNLVTRFHVIAEGEYLTLLASRYGSTVRAIVLANDIEDQNLIFPGQELLIPVLP